jgi:hypothetical protein
MKFSLLLFALGARLTVNSLASEKFRKPLRLSDFTVVMRTADGTRARTFYFKKGFCFSRGGRSPKADAELVWCDPETAVRTMLSKDELDGFSAIGSSKLRILGDFQRAFKFIDIAG